MSTKDRRYKRDCPICGDSLPGTGDGLLVFEALKDQLEDIESGATYTPNCDLCGEDVSLEQAREIVAAGEPKLQETGESEDGEDF